MKTHKKHIVELYSKFRIIAVKNMFTILRVYGTVGLKKKYFPNFVSSLPLIIISNCVKYCRVSIIKYNFKAEQVTLFLNYLVK